MTEYDEYMQKLLNCIFNTHPESEMSCTACERELTRVAEEVALGAKLSDASPAVDMNLQFCPNCREEFEALVAIIRAEKEGKLDS